MTAPIVIRFRVRNEIKVEGNRVSQRIRVECVDDAARDWVDTYRATFTAVTEAAFGGLQHRKIDQDLVTAAAAKLQSALRELGGRMFEVAWGFTPPPPPVVFEDDANLERVEGELRQAATGTREEPS